MAHPVSFFQIQASDARSLIKFYQKAFDAIILKTWDNADGSVHVAEMEIQGALFHLHEEVSRSQQLSPETTKATTSLIGIFTPDTDRFMQQAADSALNIFKTEKSIIKKKYFRKCSRIKLHHEPQTCYV